MHTETEFNSVVDENGFLFETLIPEQRVSTTSQLTFGVRITNQTLAPQKFLLFYLQPLFFRKNDKWKQVAYKGCNVNGTGLPTSVDCQIVSPGDAIDFLVKGEFFREDNNLLFRYHNKSREYHFWQHFKPAIHGIQCQYISPAVGQKAEYTSLRWVDFEDTWVGKVLTPLVEFQLIDS